MLGQYVADQVAAVIAAHGENVTLTRTTTAAADEATPWIPGAPTVTVYSFVAKVSGVAAQYVDGALILASDQMVICAPADVVPQMGDVLQINGADKEIKRIQPAGDGGITAIYRIFVAS